MTVILSDGRRQQAGLLLAKLLRQLGEDTVHVALEDRDIRPCTGCGSCSGRTFGRCMQQDEMQAIYPLVADARQWVLVSPMRFGGLSFTAKKVQERLSVLGDVRYFVKGGELVKGMHAGSFFAVGTTEFCTEKEADVFRRLHRENIQIMNCKGEAFLTSPHPDRAEMQAVADVLRKKKVHG